MNDHNCDKCQSKGQCPIEDMTRTIQFSYRTQGVAGLLNCVDAALKQPAPNGPLVRATVGISLETIGLGNLEAAAAFGKGLQDLFDDAASLKEVMIAVMMKITNDTMEMLTEQLTQFSGAVGVKMQHAHLSTNPDDLSAMMADAMKEFSEKSPTPDVPPKSNLH